MLAGLKVVCTGSVIACPWAATLMAEHGASVIQVESQLGMDTVHYTPLFWAQEHRNELDIALDIPGKGREIFFKLLKWADIFMESSKGGTYAKWGLTDDVLWEQNPQLIIVHVSGFGEEGVPEYVTRASYDAVGQAFGGYSFINGFPDPMPPMRANPYTCDYVTALNVTWSALAALRNRDKTGQGESIDIAQFEMMTRIMAQYPITYFEEGKVIPRLGNSDPGGYGYDIYECKGGGYAFVGAAGPSPFKRALKVLGLDPADYTRNPSMAVRDTPEGIIFEETLKKFCLERTNEEVDAIFMEAQVPCSAIMNMEQMARNPHYEAREVFKTWYDEVLDKEITGVNIMPRVKNAKPEIWRGSPAYGADTRDILEELGYSEAEIDKFFEEGAVK